MCNALRAAHFVHCTACCSIRSLHCVLLDSLTALRAAHSALEPSGTAAGSGPRAAQMERLRLWNCAQRHTLTLKCVNFVNFVNFL